MTHALALPRDLLLRAWLAAGGLSVLALLLVAAAFAPGSTVAPAAPQARAETQAVVTIEEPWIPGVMTFSGERTTSARPATALDDLDPNCLCIGFY